MYRDKARKFYKSKAWQDVRSTYIQSVNGLCEHCLAKGVITPGYIVDHIIELNESNLNDPDVTLNPENLQYLCLSCHNTKTFGSSPTRDGLMFDDEGNLVEVKQKPDE